MNNEPSERKNIRQLQSNTVRISKLGEKGIVNSKCCIFSTNVIFYRFLKYALCVIVCILFYSYWPKPSEV